MAMMRRHGLLLVSIALCTMIVLPVGSVAQPEESLRSMDVAVSPDASVESSGQTLSEVSATTPSEEVIEIGSAQRIVGGPKTDIGKEMEEPKSPIKLFQSEQDIERLLGTKPRFVYDPKDYPDPMIIPWIRRDVLVREILDVARKQAAKGNFAAAKELLTRALKDYPDSRHITAVQDEIKKIEEMERKGITGVGQQEVVLLPSWVASHTNGILWSEEKPLVLVGDVLLSEGDEVPRYVGVTVKKINKQEVEFSFKGRTFPVAVRGDK
jgi:hypothetical protein